MSSAIALADLPGFMSCSPKSYHKTCKISLGELKGRASHKPVQRWEAQKPFQNSHLADLNMLSNLRVIQLYESQEFLLVYFIWVTALFGSVSPHTSCVLQRSLRSWNMGHVLELPSSYMWFKGSKLPILPLACYPTHESTGLCSSRYLLISRPPICLTECTQCL